MLSTYKRLLHTKCGSGQLDLTLIHETHDASEQHEGCCYTCLNSVKRAFVVLNCHSAGAVIMFCSC